MMKLGLGILNKIHQNPSLRCNLNLRRSLPPKDVMDSIKLYSIFKGVPVKFKKNDKVRVRVKCTNSCPFELYCGRMKDEDTWIVKKLNPEHNCGRRFKNRFASSN